MLIGSLVELHVGLHSCLCFSHLEKLVLKAGSTPPRYLLNTLLFVELLQLFLIAFLIASRYLVDRSRKLLPPQSFSTAGGQIELLFLHLMDCSLTPSRYLYLLTTISQIPSSIAVLIPLNTCIYRALLRAYIISSCDPPIIFFDLSLDSSLIFLS